ncbi:succinate dehydrogenase assembly factor 2-B, mitochondrial-like [Pararge aegeria]|uniref:Succinate dehydrogenase assembly factor 2, mitochondrial n=1 Tax=Pararge aegeria aegeria TaxID=348720 RepID=A0A8S4SGK9_9NEOP|nr:succinate dehydrogenase assembly factor 2-B, mitochondrial-like [Pararge aegeria]XP_039746176.1 succinate dehydrogenase assembly factor 2-B, mitochondrial-like [Pararge aegeria]CAH2268182.1 jg8189 [Pararge aegeria aegeria]
MLRSKIVQVSNVARNLRVVGFSSDTTKDVDTTYMEIPVYNVDKPQTLEKRKARLHYQSRKRGMLENDLLLSTFAKKYLDGFTEEQTMKYDRLINSPSNDWDIFYWMVGKKPTPTEFDNEIMEMLKQHAKNEERVTLSQPPLH